MVKWGKLFNFDEEARREHLQRWNSERRLLLPSHADDGITSAIPAKRVTIVALRLKYLIEQAIPCELKESHVLKPRSPILTRKVIKLAADAAGEEDKACVVYCLLVCMRWFKKQARLEMFDADLDNLRALACQKIAKSLIESQDEEDQDFLFQRILLQRYSIIRDGEETVPMNAVERAVDLHATTVIGSSGYQKCIAYIWRGWLMQNENNPADFIGYKNRSNPDYWAHFTPDRMRTPRYQNAVQILMSFIYLILFTVAINTVNPKGDIDIVELFLYIFTLGFVCDELSKLWKVGRYYLSFWNVFNCTLYGFLAVSFILRIVALGHPIGDDNRVKFNHLSYNFLAFSAPMFWIRLLLYLDTFRFFGAMLVVVKVMMKESLIFFALLFVVIVGFLQAFIGMDFIDDNKTVTSFILQSMANAVMQSPDFSGFGNFAPPFGIILYYIFTFIVMVVLLNILIALYNSAYTDITENAIDEYMALFSSKALQFVRAPDENVFIAPFNLIEIFFLILPFEWWLSKARYERLNDYVMGTIYAPLLLVTAAIEVHEAKKVQKNRDRNAADDDTIEEWEELAGEALGDSEAAGKWKKQVENTVPDVEVDEDVREIRKLKEDIADLKKIVLELKDEKASDGNEGASGDGSLL